MAKPLCIDKDDLPSESLSKEEQFFREQALKEGKPKDIVDKIVAGKLEKYYKQVCLLRQPFVKDEDQSIQDLVNNSIAKFGENVVFIICHIYLLFFSSKPEVPSLFLSSVIISSKFTPADSRVTNK